MKQKILIDVDGVIADFHRHFVKYVNKSLGTKFRPQDLQGWTLGHVDPKEVYELHESYVREGQYGEIPTYFNAPQHVREIAQRRDILICTARKPDLQTITKAWLSYHGLNQFELLHSDKKIDVCKERDIGEIIEDNIETLDLAHAAKIIPYAVERTHNKSRILDDQLSEKPKYIVVRGLDEVIKYL